jgi:hypothetical protein
MKHPTIISLAACIALLLITYVACAQTPDCSRTLLEGSYTLSWKSAADEVPQETLNSSIRLDANGSLSGKYRLTIGESIIQDTISGRYTLNENCTGYAILITSLGVSHQAHFTTAPQGLALEFENEDPNNLLMGIARKSQCIKCDTLTGHVNAFVISCYPKDTDCRLISIERALDDLVIAKWNSAIGKICGKGMCKGFQSGFSCQGPTLLPGLDIEHGEDETGAGCPPSKPVACYGKPDSPDITCACIP